MNKFNTLYESIMESLDEQTLIKLEKQLSDNAKVYYDKIQPYKTLDKIVQKDYNKLTGDENLSEKLYEIMDKIIRDKYIKQAKKSTDFEQLDKKDQEILEKIGNKIVNMIIDNQFKD